jgi:hypothetical protein
MSITWRRSCYTWRGETIPRENVAIRINTHGEIVVPPLTVVSKQLRYETRGYVHSAIKRPGIIHAQVMPDDSYPLLKRLFALGKAYGIPYPDLEGRVVVDLLGRLGMDSDNWVIKLLCRQWDRRHKPRNTSTAGLP